VLTDISNEPDDEESLVRLLVYANEFDVEGLVATTSTWLRRGPREDLIRRDIAAYGQVRDNLAQHASGYPTAKALLEVTASGQSSYGMAAVGEGKSTPGSRLILAAADRDDPRPLWVSVWGGANTLAQALSDARRERSREELQRLVAKLRVYTISDQDDAGPWLRRQFPELSYIVSPSNPDSREYHRATWTGISGDRHYSNAPFHHFELVDNPWLEKNVINDHGPLGALYPKLAYIMEGDTPSFLGLVSNGLAWRESPAYGGWGGRYVLYRCYGETRPIWTNNRDSRDTVSLEDGKTYTSDQATIWRWRQAYQHDFAARMDWCVRPFAQANHNPQVVVGTVPGKGILRLDVRSGQEVTLSAAGSSDPDGDALSFRWFDYPEAGAGPRRPAIRISGADTKRATLSVPEVRRPTTMHVILEVKDDGAPCLFSYRRIILNVTTANEPALGPASVMP
jgi:hypothetical protein